MSIPNLASCKFTAVQYITIPTHKNKNKNNKKSEGPEFESFQIFIEESR